MFYHWGSPTESSIETVCCCSGSALPISFKSQHGSFGETGNFSYGVYDRLGSL